MTFLLGNLKHGRRGILSIPRIKVTDKFSAVLCHFRVLSEFFSDLYFLSYVAAFPLQKSTARIRIILGNFSDFCCICLALTKIQIYFQVFSFIVILPTWQFQHPYVLSDPVGISDVNSDVASNLRAMNSSTHRSTYISKQFHSALFQPKGTGQYLKTDLFLKVPVVSEGEPWLRSL